MKIALCDADKESISKTKELLNQYANKNKFDFVVIEFYSSESILSSSEKFDIFIIEYNLKGINGMETAKIIRQRNIDSTIIFLSRYTGFVLEAFTVNAFRFLIKPVSSTLLFSTLDEFFIENGYDYPLWIKDGDNTVCLNTKEIVYLEADNKHCFVNLKDEKIKCNKTMSKVYETLPKCHFQKINRAYIVNYNYISGYNNDVVFLSNGNKLHVSRKYFKNFKEEYRNFSNPKEP